MPPELSVRAVFGDHPYTTLVEEIRDFAIFLIDPESRIASWNQGARLIFGYDKDEIVGQAFSRLFVPEDRQSGVSEREIETARSAGRAEDTRWHLRKDGSRFWANGVTTALLDEAGELLGFAKIARDDTSRKRDEENLRESQERFELVARATSDAVWDWNLGTDEVWWNQNVRALFGHAPGSVESATAWWKEHVHPEDRARVEARVKRVLNGDGQAWTIEYRFARADGSFAHVFDRGYVLHDASGRPVRLLGATMDISSRKQLEVEKQIFERLAHNSPDFIAMCDLEMRPIYRNPAAERLLGLRNSEGVKRPEIADYFFPEDRDFIFGEFFPRVFREGKGTVEIRLRHFETGEAVWMNYQLFLLRDVDGEPLALATMSRDISARKKNEAERENLLQRVEFERGRLAAIFHKAPGFIAVLRGPNHIFEMANPAYFQLIGHRDILGKPLLQALPEIAGQGFIELLDTVLETGVPFEGREISALLQPVPGGAVEERFVDLLYQPIFEADGAISGVFAHGIDITAQVRARRAAEEANRVKDEFLATLSHELRTPLTAILGWAHIIQGGQLGPEETERAMNTIERNARAQSQLIEDILDVSRVITGKLRLEVQPVDLSGIIDEALNTVSPAAQAKEIRLQHVLDAGASIVSGDPARLQQIVWNLLSNAIKFTPKSGQVLVSLERVNSHVEITVSDSGAGIAPDVLPHVFDRFRQADSSSTRLHGGLGLGLAIVRHLVELHGGSVEAQSEGAGRGATFSVKLPLVAVRSLNLRQSDAARGEQRVHPHGGGQKSADRLPRLDGLHVLVADDQEDTRAFLAVILQKCGARVSQVGSASAALAALQELRPDVLLSDIGMPDEDGFSLIKQVRALSPEQGGRTPAAALTAFARIEDRVKVLRSGFQFHLPKPIEPLELVTVVASLAGRRDDD